MSGEDDQLNRELTELFQDERLSMRPTVDAEERILVGAQRIRRRRKVLTAAGGVALSAAVIAGGFLVNNVRGTSLSPAAGSPPALSLESSNGSLPPPASTRNPAASPRSTLSPPQSSTMPSVKAQVDPTGQLGPTGYRNLRLGMTLADAKATGALAADSVNTSECQVYRLSEGNANVATVTISPKMGVVGFLASGAHTAEGIKVGAPEAELKAAYPQAQASPDGYSVWSGSQAVLHFTVTRGMVSSFQLLSSEQPCQLPGR